MTRSANVSTENKEPLRLPVLDLRSICTQTHIQPTTHFLTNVLRVLLFFQEGS